MLDHMSHKRLMMDTFNRCSGGRFSREKL